MSRRKNKHGRGISTDVAIILFYLYFGAYTIAMGVTLARWNSSGLRVYTGYCLEYFDQQLYRNTVTKFRLDNGDILRIDSGLLTDAGFNDREFRAVMNQPLTFRYCPYWEPCSTSHFLVSILADDTSLFNEQDTKTTVRGYFIIFLVIELLLFPFMLFAVWDTVRHAKIARLLKKKRKERAKAAKKQRGEHRKA